MSQYIRAKLDGVGCRCPSHLAIPRTFYSECWAARTTRWIITRTLVNMHDASIFEGNVSSSTPSCEVGGETISDCCRTGSRIYADPIKEEGERVLWSHTASRESGQDDMPCLAAIYPGVRTAGATTVCLESVAPDGERSSAHYRTAMTLMCLGMQYNTRGQQRRRHHMQKAAPRHLFSKHWHTER